MAIAHQSAVVLIHWAIDTYAATDLAGVAAGTSICFDLSIFEIFVPLSCGGTILLINNALQIPTLADRQVTLLNTVPSVMAEVLRSGALPASVQAINLAGEPLSRALTDALYQAAPTARVYNLYGPSEDTTYSTYTIVPPHESRPPTIGRPIANTQAYILDAEMQPVPIGVVGELYLGGDGLARGYLNRPELTAERFVPDPFSAISGARLYKTGDLARYLADGQIDFLGRSDQQVKLRGFRIELGEIEAALLRHPVVREAVVVTHTEAGDTRLVAYVVEQRTENQEPSENQEPTSEHGNTRTREHANTEPKGADLPPHLPQSRQKPADVQGRRAPSGLGDESQESELRSFLTSHLPAYMIPSIFVTLDTIPLTPSGKIDRKALPQPDRSRRELGAEVVLPRTPLEATLGDIWTELLGIEQVGIHDNFFHLGGHSLLVTQMVVRLRDTVQLELPVHSLFETPTIAGLAKQIETLRWSAQDTSVLVDDLGEDMEEGTL